LAVRKDKPEYQQMGGRFLVGHNEGTFLFDNASLGKINNERRLES
jgi:hypothetical protein